MNFMSYLISYLNLKNKIDIIYYRSKDSGILTGAYLSSIFNFSKVLFSNRTKE